MKQIAKGTTVGGYLDSVINETLKQTLHQKALDEKEKQVSFSSKNDGGEKTSSSSGEEKSDTNFDDIHNKEDSKSVEDDTDAMKGDVKLDDVIEKLNTIRSGKSFKDSLVTQRFEEYFGGLDDAEKVAMFTFLKGIAQIVTGEVDAEQAAEPSDKPADVKMKKGPDVQQKNVKPHVVKKPEPAQSPRPAPKSGGEDTSSPIQVKKRG